jgi:hypothetical protein
VNVVSSPNRVIPHPLIERSGNHPTGAHHTIYLLDGKFVGDHILVVRDFPDVFPEELP